jgi:hypothetical protein
MKDISLIVIITLSITLCVFQFELPSLTVQPEVQLLSSSQQIVTLAM